MTIKMFTKKVGNKQESKHNIDRKTKRADSEAIASIIDQHMTIEGDIEFSGKIRINGIIKGNVKGNHLIIGEKGKITGSVTVSFCNCHGNLEGDIKADMLTAREGCTIQGKLATTSLAVELGATIQGELKMTDATEDDKSMPQTKAKTDGRVRKEEPSQPRQSGLLTIFCP